MFCEEVGVILQGSLQAAEGVDEDEDDEAALDRPQREGFRLERNEDLEEAEAPLLDLSLLPNILLLAALDLDEEVGVEPLNVRISVVAASSLLLLRLLLRLGGFLRFRTSLNRLRKKSIAL